jgi:hypothetical protein
LTCSPRMYVFPGTLRPSQTKHAGIWRVLPGRGRTWLGVWAGLNGDDCTSSVAGYEYSQAMKPWGRIMIPGCIPDYRSAPREPAKFRHSLASRGGGCHEKRALLLRRVVFHDRPRRLFEKNSWLSTRTSRAGMITGVISNMQIVCMIEAY